MVRNICCGATNAIDNPGAFELMAHVDGAPLAIGGTAIGIRPEELDRKFYDYGGQLDAKYKPLLDELKANVEKKFVVVESKTSYIHATIASKVSPVGNGTKGSQSWNRNCRSAPTT